MLGAFNLPLGGMQLGQGPGPAPDPAPPTTVVFHAEAYAAGCVEGADYHA